MALPAAEGVTKAVLNFTWDQQLCANVMHFVEVGGVQAPDPQELAERLALWWEASVKVAVAQSVSLVSVSATDLSSDAEPGVIVTTGLPESGSVGQVSLPNNVSCVMSLRTGLRGRSFRGRIYHVGLAEGMVVDNRVSTVPLADLVGAYGLLTNLAGGGGEPVHQIAVLSYFANNALRSSPVATPVTSVTSDGIIDSQRRRLPGRGR